jgi:hypothetical protein
MAPIFLPRPGFVLRVILRVAETWFGQMSFGSMNWDPTILLRRADTCSRLADQAGDPIQMAKLAQE